MSSPEPFSSPKRACFSRTRLNAEGSDSLYRFFELFDLKNIPKSELMMYAAKKGLVTVTPPYKPALEEKLAFGLFHHPELAAFWEQALPNGLLSRLQRVLPRTWILDPRPVPRRRSFRTWQSADARCRTFRRLAQTTQKERQLVIKPSGFSELAQQPRGLHRARFAANRMGLRLGTGAPVVSNDALRVTGISQRSLVRFQPTSMNDAIPWCRCPGEHACRPTILLSATRPSLAGCWPRCALQQKSSMAWSMPSWRPVRSTRTSPPRERVPMVADTHRMPHDRSNIVIVGTHGSDAVSCPMVS